MLTLNDPAIQRRLDERLEKTTFIFDADNPNYTPNHEHNEFFIARAQNMFNDILYARGYVFLNDVLKQLDIAPTMVGQLAGWRKDASGFVEIKIEQTRFGNDNRPVEYFLKIQTDGIIIDVLGD